MEPGKEPVSAGNTRKGLIGPFVWMWNNFGKEQEETDFPEQVILKFRTDEGEIIRIKSASDFARRPENLSV